MFRSWRTGLSIVAAGCCLAVPIGGSLACRYHGLGDGFSAQHPHSIDVAMAVRQAMDEGALAEPGKLPAFLAFARANATLERFREVLATGLRSAEAPQSVALLLVEAGLWTRYHFDKDRLVAEVHASGPRSGDTVIVTVEPVVLALLAGRLSIEQAIDHGLLVIADQSGAAQPAAAALYRAFRMHDH